jgi:hypothetical protein
LSNNTNRGWGLIVSKTAATAFAVNVQTAGGQSIDDYGTNYLLDDFQVQLFISTGTGWKLS